MCNFFYFMLFSKSSMCIVILCLIVMHVVWIKSKDYFAPFPHIKLTHLTNQISIKVFRFGCFVCAPPALLSCRSLWWLFLHIELSHFLGPITVKVYILQARLSS